MHYVVYNTQHSCTLFSFSFGGCYNKLFNVDGGHVEHIGAWDEQNIHN